MSTPYKEELIIDLKVNDGCELDEVNNLTFIDDTFYYIAEDGVIDYEPLWSHTEPSCPVAYMVSRIEGGVERDLTADEKLVLTHDTRNGWMQL